VPEYLAPGVYVEETSFRPKSIEGVSTSTAAFIGPTRFGPLRGEPELLTSFADFERIYGGLDKLDIVTGAPQMTGSPPEVEYPTETVDNYVAHGVRAFFEEGGRRCYVVRTYREAEPAPGDGSPPTGLEVLPVGTATGTVPAPVTSPPSTQPLGLTLVARYPGAAGNLRVEFLPVVGRNLLVDAGGTATLRGAEVHDVVVVTSTASPPTTTETFYDVDRNVSGEFILVAADGSTQAVSGLNPTTDAVRRLTVTVQFERPLNRPGQPGALYDTPEVLEDFMLFPDDRRSLATYFNEEAPSRRVALQVPFYLHAEDLAAGGAITGADYARSLFALDVAEDEVAVTQCVMDGGNDGQQSGVAEYEGDTDSADVQERSGLKAVEDIEDVSILAAPGYTARIGSEDVTSSRILGVQGLLISHCERMRYRIAVLDTPSPLTPSEAREYRGTISSTYAALYYPWVTIFDPISRRELNLPPSGFITGIYARNDADRGVQKAPGNEVLRLAIGVETRINTAQQDVLNPESVNCIRFFEGRGYRLWGARLTTDDAEYKYVNIRRYLAYLERSIDEGTQVFVFESNGPALWDNVRRTVDNFLRNEWQSGRLLGRTDDEAYFVRCDLSTMTQNDLDNGRLICEVGVSLLRPAEYVIFRIGQKLIETGG